MRELSGLSVGLVGLAIFFCCGGSGAVCALAAAPAIDKQADEYASLPTNPDVTVGEKVALTGILSNNDIITNDADMGDISGDQVVAYKLERYKRTTSSSSKNRNTSGSWDTVRTVADTLKMDLNGTTITFYGGNGADLSGDMHQFQQGSSLSTGSLRISGFRNGDQVTIIAKRQQDGRFMADKIYGGTRDDLVKDTRTVGKVIRYLGFGGIGIGAIFGLGALLAAVLIFRRPKPQQPQQFPPMWPPTDNPPTFPPASS